jgi:hypothetical protein
MFVLIGLYSLAIQYGGRMKTIPGARDPETGLSNLGENKLKLDSRWSRIS